MFLKSKLHSCIKDDISIIINIHWNSLLIKMKYFFIILLILVRISELMLYNDYNEMLIYFYD